MRKHAGWLVFCGLLVAPCVPASDSEVPFTLTKERSVILVHVRINDRAALLILDTGSAQTILRPELAGVDPAALERSRFSGSGPGLEARGRWGEATLQLGQKVWRRWPVVAMKLDEVTRVYGSGIDGLLGHDLLREFDRITIDFRTRTLRLSANPGALDNTSSPPSASR